MASNSGNLCKAKQRRAAKHAKANKYMKQFVRTVKRTGRWRGHPATVDMARGPHTSGGINPNKVKS